jgi:hypothetical protein
MVGIEVGRGRLGFCRVDVLQSLPWIFLLEDRPSLVPV